MRILRFLFPGLFYRPTFEKGGITEGSNEHGEFVVTRHRSGKPNITLPIYKSSDLTQYRC